MAHINFVIPQNKRELLSECDQQYYVRNVVSIKEIHVKLKNAEVDLRNEGAEYIIENFDTYYSVLHHADTIQMNHMMSAYETLHKAAQELNKYVTFLLEDPNNLNEELNTKSMNIIKMLLYVYINITTMIEQKLELKRNSLTVTQKGRGRKGGNKNEECEEECDKQAMLVVLNNIIQHDINLFWDPPVVEETFTNLVAEACYRLLEISSIKGEKETLTELFNMLGTLIKKYNHGMTFVVRIGQIIKMCHHVVSCISEGIKLLVENFNCKSLVRDFVREITEWQTDENFQDVQGTRNCSEVLLNMANLMPDLMIPEVMYLNRYLAHDSYTLRNSVLGVIVEVVINVLTKDNLNEEEREYRDEFLEILEEHISDTSSYVRSKVFQHWSRLQQENAIPQKIQGQILQKAIFHLRDKAATTRKCACNCVTTFLSHNIYGAQLKLDVLEKELEEKTDCLAKMKEQFESSRLAKLKEVEEQWNAKEKMVIEKVEQKLKEGDIDIPSESQISKKDLPELVRLYITEEKYEDAFELCRCAGSHFPQWSETRKNLSEKQEVDLFVALMKTIFTDLSSYYAAESSENQQVPEESDLKNLEALENVVEYLGSAVNFLKLIDESMLAMVDLLESTSIGDMQEAVEFFIAAYQFNINNALSGILEMLKIMQRNEKERKDVVIKAFKKIYLTTDASNMQEHTTTIVDRLIKLLEIVPFENIQDLHLIISQLVSNAYLDNSIIDMLWQYFTKKVNVSDEHSRAALQLLTMASAGRKTIISKNIKLVATVAFGDRGKNDPLLVAYACKILDLAGQEKQDITDQNPPFKIKNDDPIWKNLESILIENLYTKSQYYNMMASNAISFIYGVCSRPDKITDSLIEKITNNISLEAQNNQDKLPGYVIAQYSHLIGKVAVEVLNFLDECVYKELKRRNYIREERKSNQKTKKNKPTNVRNASNSLRKNTSSRNQSTQSVMDESSVVADESTLEGAQADDTDAEFILNVLENNIVNESSGLGQLISLLVGILERPDIYDDLYLQGIIVNALMRFMMVSSRCCRSYIQLIFTVLEKTGFAEVKCNILIQCSDLLERFPNIVEPWTPHLYSRLKDKCKEVRISTFFMLANLILRDMIRIQGHISEMASCIVDDDDYLKNMSKNFFIQLSQKANNLYNILPDIFSHLADQQTLSEDNLQFIMKLLFGLIDKNKQMENLVDRFVSKFRLTEDNMKCRNIAYCLSLINYNEKGLRRLLDSFGIYKNFLLHDDVYAIFKQILNTCNKSVKPEIKEITAEFEERINSVFETDQDGNPVNKPRPQPKPKSAFKKPRGKPPRKKQKTVARKPSSDDEGSDPESRENESVAEVRKSSRTPRRVQRKIIVDSDEDSD